MKKFIVLLIGFLSFTSYAQTDKELVLKAFDNYKKAILADKGEEAVNFVDSRTVNYYADILEKVKKSDSVAVDAMGIIDKVMVLSLRHRAPKKELLSFDGKELIIYAINNGMVGKNGVANASLGAVTTKGDFAKAEFLVHGQKTPFFFHFYKESNAWKMDLTHLSSLGETGFKQLVKDSGKSENTFLMDLMGMLTGTKASNAIWQPIQ